jgi:hypothetical protein
MLEESRGTHVGLVGSLRWCDRKRPGRRGSRVQAARHDVRGGGRCRKFHPLPCQSHAPFGDLIASSQLVKVHAAGHGRTLLVGAVPHHRMHAG